MSIINEPGTIEFPVQYTLKVVFQVTGSEDRHESGLIAVLTELSIPFGSVSRRNSGAGRYISCSVPVTVADRQTYDRLYQRIKGLDNVKFAL